MAHLPPHAARAAQVERAGSGGEASVLMGEDVVLVASPRAAAAAAAQQAQRTQQGDVEMGEGGGAEGRPAPAGAHGSPKYQAGESFSGILFTILMFVDFGRCPGQPRVPSR